VLLRLADSRLGNDSVFGLGPSTVSSLGVAIPGLHEPTVLSGPGASLPVSPAALWCWLRGEDRGQLLHRGRQLEALLAPSYRLESIRDTFLYDGGRDLTGYEDGTENPKGDAAEVAAFVAGQGEGLDGSSFAALQLWLHDLQRFESFSAEQRDALMGRRRSDNEELASAPVTAHVKRAAQESYTPTAFLLRRSMPWVDGATAGLYFLAFGRSFEAFEAISRRMFGAEDGIQDALFQYSRPVSLAYFWCPPTRSGQLDLSRLGF